MAYPHLPHEPAVYPAEPTRVRCDKCSSSWGPWPWSPSYEGRLCYACHNDHLGLFETTPRCPVRWWPAVELRCPICAVLQYFTVWRDKMDKYGLRCVGRPDAQRCKCPKLLWNLETESYDHYDCPHNQRPPCGNTFSLPRNGWTTLLAAALDKFDSPGWKFFAEAPAAPNKITVRNIFTGIADPKFDTARERWFEFNMDEMNAAEISCDHGDEEACPDCSPEAFEPR